MALASDPVDFLLDAQGDVVLGSDLQWSTGVAAVAQGIRIALQLFRGEWFLDLDEGVPYLERDGVTAGQALLGQRFNEARALSAFRDAILRAPGVSEIVALKVTFNARTRVMLAAWTVTTALGDTVIDQLATGVS